MVASEKSTNTLILTCESLNDLYGAVNGSVINDDNFEIGIVLRQNAVECLFKIPFSVETTNCDGDEGGTHSSSLLVNWLQDTSRNRYADIRAILSSNAASYLVCVNLVAG